MRSLIAVGGLSALLLASGAASGQQTGGRGGGMGTAVQAGESCPPGTTEVRPGRCSAPEFPPPSILDYRPVSTLVTAEHLVRRAKYPAIDFHGHPGNRLGSGKTLAALGASLDSLNVGLMIAADHLSGERLQRTVAEIRASPEMRDRVRVLAGIDFRDVGPGWAEKAVAQLEADVAAGAVGVGEIPKSFGISIRKANGSGLRIDDPELDPVWEACARLGVPVFIHTADPQEFFQPLDYTNERWLELALFGNRRLPPDRFPAFEEFMTERDNLFQHRILFGKDSFQPDEHPYDWRVFETHDEYFDYYRDYHAFWKLYGIDLPDEVLREVYYSNALRITPGLPRGGWSQ